MSTFCRSTSGRACAGVRAEIAWALFLLGLTAAAYWPVLGNGFANIDDPMTIVHNPAVQQGLSWETLRWAFASPRLANWMPLTWVSLALDVRLFGPAPFGHHLTALVIHAAAALLAFAALRSLTGDLGKSLFVAALFAVHPLQVESVAWATERSNLLAGLFWFGTILLYGRYARRPAWGRYLGVAATLLLGLLAKPIVVTLPAVLLLLDYWPLGRFAARPAGRPHSAPAGRPLAVVLEKVPLLLLCLAAAGVTVFSQLGAEAAPSLETFPLGARAANGLMSYGRYLVKAAWPVDLSLYYPPAGTAIPPARVLAVALLLALLCAVVFAARRRFPSLAVGWCWYLGVLLPVIGIVQVGSQSAADRFAHVSLAGIWIALAWTIRCSRHPRGCAALAAVLLVACAAASNRQTLLWRTPTSLAEHVLAREPLNILARVDIASVQSQRGDYDMAIDTLLPPLQACRDSGALRNAVSELLEARGDYDAALYHERVAAASSAPKRERYRSRATELARTIAALEAQVGKARSTLALRPDDFSAQLLLGASLLKLGRSMEAIQPLAAAAALAPDRADVQFFVAQARAHRPHPGEERFRREELSGNVGAATGAGTP